MGREKKNFREKKLQGKSYSVIFFPSGIFKEVGVNLIH